MNSVEQARDIVFRHARPLSPEHRVLRESLGLVLAEDIVSSIDSPPFDKATMDGYAVVSADMAGGEVVLEVVEEVTAGQVPRLAIRPGQSTRIMTGAPLPDGADAVVIVEKSEMVRDSEQSQQVRLRDKKVLPGQNIIARGAAMGNGDRALARGRRIGAIETGVLAELGVSRVPAHPLPTVSILATGNELVPADATPLQGQIRNSNGPMLRALVERAGGDVVDLGVGRDETEELQRLIRQGLETDVLVLSGGVSAGVLDLVPEVLARLGVEQVFHKVKLKPGKPLWFGISRQGASDKLVFGLPGNPVSSLVCFELFVRPAMAGLAGRKPGPLQLQQAVLGADHHHRGDRPTFFPAMCRENDDSQRAVLVEPLAWQGSADLFTLAHADCLIVFPPGERHFSAGESVNVYRIEM